VNHVQSPSTDDALVELRLEGAPMPRVTLADVEANIVNKEFVKHVAPSGQILRWCVLTVRNGFAVTGDPSAAVCAENDVPELGEELAYKNARDSLWRYMGYALKERLHRRMDPLRTYEEIAFVCHEVNRAYCAALGDMSQPAWADAPDWQKQSALSGVKFHIANRQAGADASHNNWYDEKLAAGWKYGPVKDPANLEHPCMVSFHELPREQQAKDWIFRAVVHSMAGL
jgi:hypothetical protein